MLRRGERVGPSGRACESLVGDLTTDAMRLTCGTDFALTNSGRGPGDLSVMPAGATDPPTPGDFCSAGGLSGAECRRCTAPITRGQVQRRHTGVHGNVVAVDPRLTVNGA